MELVPFEPAQAAAVADWGTSAHEVTMWCGAREYPLPADEVLGWQRDDVAAHVLMSDGELVGYGELWFDDDEDEIELAHIIVAPSFRGRGLGQELVRRLAELAQATEYPDLFMRVHPENVAALRCYTKASFIPVDKALADSWNAQQPIAYVWLEHSG